MQEFLQLFSGIFDIRRRHTLAFLDESMNHPYRTITERVDESDMYPINNPELKEPFPQGTRKRHPKIEGSIFEQSETMIRLTTNIRIKRITKPSHPVIEEKYVHGQSIQKYPSIIGEENMKYT